MDKVLLVIPAYNEEKNIEESGRTILKTIFPELDYVVVNDRLQKMIRLPFAGDGDIILLIFR